MSYLQDSLVDALGGSKYLDNRSSVIRDWSPNNIKVLVISKDYILVGKHLGTGSLKFSVKNLDRNLVIQDIQEIINKGYGSKAKLNSILSKRSLSCLEELYVDTSIAGIPRVMNVSAYTEEISKTPSRLRYVGLIGDINPSDIISKFLSTKELGYALAEDKQAVQEMGIRVAKIKNDDWYKKYYLRPRYYQMDSEKGRLAIHFRKFEDDYVKYLKSKADSLESSKLDDTIKKLISEDDSNIEYFKLVDKLLSALLKNSNDPVKKIVSKQVRGIIQTDRGSVTSAKLVKLVPESSKNSAYLLKCYERYNAIEFSKSIDTKKISELSAIGDGLVGLRSILDDICLESARALSKEGYGDIVKMSVLVYGESLPKGRFSEYSGLKSCNGDCMGYFKVLGDIIGTRLY